MSDPRDEREVKADLRVKTPAWVPGVIEGGFSFRRLWDERGKRFLADTAHRSSIAPQELFSRVEQGEEFSDVFARAARKYVEHGDDVLHDLLSRLVSAALRDDTRVSEVSYLLDKLEQYQPLHVRLLVCLSATESKSTSTVARAANAADRIAAAALSELASSTFVEQGRGTETRDHALMSVTVWKLSDLGGAMLDLIAEIDSEIGQSGTNRD